MHSQSSLPPLGLYIHLPWCERKCPYCDFNSHERESIPEQAYIEALLADLQRELAGVQGRPLRSVFIGGGTPSLFSPRAIARLMDGVRSHLALHESFEATMEANPGSSEAERFAGFFAAGINRLSLGVQSFDDELLQRLGRIHDSEQAHHAVKIARAAGFENINIDLMHGLPGQTAELARSDMKTALSLHTTHLSWYQLTLEPNTVFHKRPPTLPVENTLATIQDEGEALLTEAGLLQYEVSAYSKPDRECVHNRNYWSFGDYLAIGAGAHGKCTFEDGRIVRYAKLRQPDAYMQASEVGQRVSERTLSDDDKIGEFMLNALRLNAGFSQTLFEQRTGLLSSSITQTLERLVKRKLMKIDGEVATTTALGRRFLDSVVGEFFGT
ncbi:MAG: radical SAM family heme chaperone HemW [Halioglobus sp.]